MNTAEDSHKTHAGMPSAGTDASLLPDALKQDLMTVVLERSRLGFMLFQADGRCIWTNRAISQIANMPAQDLLKIDLMRYPLYERAGLTAAAQRALQGGGRQIISYQGSAKVLNNVDVLWVVDLVQVSGTNYILLQIEDKLDTHAQEAERSLAMDTYGRTMAALKEELQLVLDTALVGLGRTQNHRWVWVNREFAQSLGYSVEELTDLPTSALFSATEHERIGAHIRNDIAKGQDTTEFDARMQGKDGTQRLFQVRGRILNRDKFESLYTFQDITDVHEQAQQLAVALKDAEAASEAKSYFLSTMSHELRTPLNGIMGVFQIMEWMDLSDKARDMVQTGKESSELLLAVLNDVLDFSRMAAGHLVLKPAPNDLYRCLASVNEMFAAMAQQRHIQLNFNLDPRLKATVVIDDVRLRQVLMNLVNNALKFTEAGSVRVQAQRLADQDARMQVQIDVIDTGIGMSEDTLGRLYQPFMQADQGNARTYQGTGLGLSIVHKLVQAMGGSIEVESTLGQGSHFTLRFNFELTQEQEQATPLAVTAHAERPTVAQIPPSGSTVVKTSPASQTAAASTAERPAPAPVAQTTSQVSAKLNVQSPLRGKQIAVIDDQQTNRVIARLMLQKAGATVHEFDDGSAFLRALRTPGTQFHAALMDLQMVPMDGLEATRLIRAERQASWRQLPIIAMTGKLMAEERQATLDAGMNGFLPKPMNYALMVETLCAALG